MNSRIAQLLTSLLVVSSQLLSSHGAVAQHAKIATGPFDLTCDSLTRPLGDDNTAPLFSWKLRDPRTAALQTAYRIQVARSIGDLTNGREYLWDSGRVVSGDSIARRYEGAPLRPATRYYWRVLVWDAQGKPYPASEVNWWETGKMGRAWQGQWIGFEDRREAALRSELPTWITNPIAKGQKFAGQTRHDFRFQLQLPQDIRSVTLYATGEETINAWMNGRQVLTAQPKTAWGHLPWKTYERRDVTAEIRTGSNLLAIEALQYQESPVTQTPISAGIVMERVDGSVTVYRTGDFGWQARLDADVDWYRSNTDDKGWESAIPLTATQDTFGASSTLGVPLQTSPVAQLSREFTSTKRVQSARLYATALGAYKVMLNGRPVSDQRLAPGWTDFRERVAYQVYDVTGLLQLGANRVEALLAPGWYSTPLEWEGQGNNYGPTVPALRAELVIAYSDGTSETILTDDHWKARESSILSSEIYDGETLDARRRTAHIDAVAWMPAQMIHPHEPAIVWQSWQPIRAAMTIAPKSVTATDRGAYIVDFGQDLAGVESVTVQGRRGTDVRLRFGEVLNKDGSLYVENLRNAKATDHFILEGAGRETFEPSFTFHGFRYMEISGLTYRPASVDLKAIVLRTDAPETIQLHSSSDLVNQLWSNIRWGQRSNFVGVPTDCPQRDERLGWTADAQVFWRTASFNMDLAAFSRKFAADLRGTQVGTSMYGIYAPGTAKSNTGFGPGWSDAGVIVPWTSWIQTGDRAVLEENWDAMAKYVNAIEKANPDGIWKNDGGIAFGDWLSPEGTTSQELVATAYFAYDVSLLQQMARALGKTDEESRYTNLFAHIKAAFTEHFVKADGVVRFTEQKGQEKIERETQTGYVLALHMHLLPEEVRAQAASHLVDRIAASQWHLQTGFLGTPYLMEVLSDSGHSDVAFRLLFNTTYPSWGYMIANGATTMWERWNGNQMMGDPGMNSFNHYAYGSVAEWLYRYAAGIDDSPSTAGFHRIRLHPSFDSRLGNLEVDYQSPYGMITSKWKVEGARVSWKVVLPANTTAELPLSLAGFSDYRINGTSLSESHFERIAATDGTQAIVLPAGSFSISVGDN